MKRFVCCLSLLALVIAAPLAAQTSEDVVELTRSVIQTERKAIVSTNMEFTEAESKVFWPVYREFKLEQEKLDDRLFDLISKFAENYETLTDEKAATLMTEYLAVEKAELELKNQYHEKLMKILSAKKVFRFFQVENKLDTIIENEMAAQIPLAQ